MNAPLNNIEFDELALKVEERLDEIFEAPASRSEIQKQFDSGLIIDHLDNLNKILLSIEPEDTDKQIVKVLKQLEHLKEKQLSLELLKLRIKKKPKSILKKA